MRVILVLAFGGGDTAGDGAQGFVCVRQELYQLSYTLGLYAIDLLTRPNRIKLKNSYLFY